MKIRVKYTKNGPMKYVGHLDIMRYFQKAFRRADLDIKYSQGYSPHQLISFAAPLSLGVTSDGEYFDAEMNSVLPSKEMCDRLNATMVEYISVKAVVLLREGAKPAMSVVAGSDYLVTRKEDAEEPYSEEEFDHLFNALDAYLSQKEIFVLKKTKKSEREMDIKPLIYDMHIEDRGIFMQLSSGSIGHIKPELVLENLCSFASVPYRKMAFRVHKTETYMLDEKENLVSLLSAGDEINLDNLPTNM